MESFDCRRFHCGRCGYYGLVTETVVMPEACPACGADQPLDLKLEDEPALMLERGLGSYAAPTPCLSCEKPVDASQPHFFVREDDEELSDAEAIVGLVHLNCEQAYVEAVRRKRLQEPPAYAGFLYKPCDLVHADKISDVLGQASHFLDQGYDVPAAVLAGKVLEGRLWELCTQHANLQPADNINKMNDDLARENVYDNILADQIRAWANIKDAAAAGKPAEFNEDDVKRMIDGIRHFVANQMS